MFNIIKNINGFKYIQMQRSISNRATIHFSKETGSLAMQTLGSLDALYNSVDETEKKFKELGATLEKETNGKFFLGPVKERSVAEEKIATDLGGKSTLISDIVRAKIVVNSPEAIAILRTMLNPTAKNTHDILNKRKAYSAQMADYFADPKFETGYRALNAKIAIPIGKESENEEESEFHLVELQVVHQDIESIYDRTHRHMREAQNIAAKYRHEQIPNNEAYRMAAHYAVCRFENGCAAKSSGLDLLLDNPNAGLTKQEADSLKYMIHDFRLDY